MATGRQCFEKFLNGEPIERPAFVPLIRGLTARTEGVSRESLTSDPTSWANSIMKTTELFDFDGVVVGFDFAILAQACGCSVSWRNDRPVLLAPTTDLNKCPEESGYTKHALETAARVFEVCRNERGCVAALAGPVTLASQLYGRETGPDRIGDVKDLIVRVEEAFCETRPDVIIFMEGRPLALTKLTIKHRKIYNTLKNIASYYDIRTGLYLQGYRTGNMDQFSALNMDIYVLGPSEDETRPSIAELWDLGSEALGIGLGLPISDYEDAKNIIKEGMDLYNARKGKGLFFTSFGPLTRDVDMDTLHALVDEIKKNQM